MIKTEMPDPHETWIVNNVGLGVEATLRAHLAGLRLLAEASEPYDIEFAPLGENWITLVSALGTWVRGPGREVRRFLDDWKREADETGIAIAPYVSR